MQPHSSWDCKEKNYFLIVLSFPLNFRVSLFLPRSLLPSPHLESFSSLSILASRLQIGTAQISVKALGGQDSDRCRLVWARGSPWVDWIQWVGLVRFDGGQVGFGGGPQWLLGWFRWWVCGSAKLKGMDLNGCLWLSSGFRYESQLVIWQWQWICMLVIVYGLRLWKFC